MKLFLIEKTYLIKRETNLKLYRTIPQTYKYLDKELLTLKGEIECEVPHHLLDTFNGKLIIDDKTFSLEAKQLLLRVIYKKKFFEKSFLLTKSFFIFKREQEFETLLMFLELLFMLVLTQNYL